MITQTKSRIRSRMVAFAMLAVAMIGSDIVSTSAQAGGFGGRGGGRSIGGGGGRSFGGGGGGARPSFGGAASRPSFGGNQMSRPNFNHNAARPSLGGSGGAALNRPISRPASTRPASRPNFGSGIPSSPSMPSLNRPSVSKPAINRPSASRPTVNRPDFSKPGGFTKPTLPKPGLKDKPGIGNKPGIDNKPGIATKPGGIGSAGNRPNINRPGNNRPTIDRPSAGEVGDFLGLGKPLRPDARPNRPSTLPGRIPDRKPSIGNGIGNGNLGGRGEINIGDINIGNNNVIGNRPSWVDIDRNQVGQINNRWSNQIGSINNWQNRYPDRFDRRRDWGNEVRGCWFDPGFSRPGCYRPGYFRPNWWANHPFRFAGWSYIYAYNSYPYTYWYTTPTYVQTTQWVSSPTASMSAESPVYYDYGDGGNVTIEDNRVYIGGEEIASTDEFAESAADLATVEPPAGDDAAKEAEWLPLGTFALTTDRDDVNPGQVVQLAVSKSGVISGTLYNEATDKTQAIQGSVDKETQRVAMRLGDSDTVVAESGLYNLTQDEASVLVHFGKEKTENYLLVRLEVPDEGASTEDASNQDGKQG